MSVRREWQAIEEGDAAEHFLLFRYGSVVGEINLDVAALGGEDRTRARVQDLVIILNAPEIIDAWLAVRRQERGRIR